MSESNSAPAWTTQPAKGPPTSRQSPHTLPQIPTVIAAFAICTPAFALAGAAAKCPTIADAAARLACYDDAFAPKLSSAPGVAPVPKSAPTGTAVVAANSDTFGLPQKTAALEPQAITSMVDEDFDGWGPNDRIRLHNGQIWEVMDGSRGTTTPAMRRVTIKRGALGSYFQEFDGLTKSPRVRRVKQAGSSLRRPLQLMLEDVQSSSACGCGRRTLFTVRSAHFQPCCTLTCLATLP